MENERSYAKESFKSKPTGIRFNLEQEKVAFMRSKKKTRQQLVDFLLENYVKGENPITERLSTQPDKPLFFNTEVKQQISKRKTPQEWVDEKREIPDGNTEMYKKWLAELDASDLTTKVKTEIKFA